MNIRLAEESDLGKAAGLWAERAALLQQSGPLHGAVSVDSEKWKSEAKSWLIDDSFAFHVAVEGSALGGYAVATVCYGLPGLVPSQVGRVVDMAVDLHRAQRGLATGLLDATRSWLALRQVSVLTIDVPAAYPVEEAFWRAQGARPRFNQHWLTL